MLEVSDLGVWYPTRGVAVSGVSLAAEPGEVLLLTGRNGSGASSVLAGINATLPAGSRRQGRVSLSGVDVSDNHPDDLRGVVAMVGDADPAPALRISDLVRGSGKSVRHDQAGLRDELVERLGLAECLDTKLARASRSLLTRAALAETLIARPRVLLADQPLAPLESHWQDEVCEILREQADAGMIIVWAEHHLTAALAVADTVIELQRAGSEPAGATASQFGADPAWSWHPHTLPLTPFQQVASALEIVAPGINSVQGMRAALDGRLTGGPQARQPSRRETSRITIQLGPEEAILVRDDQLIRVDCPSAEVASSLYDSLAKQNGFAPASVRGSARLEQICRLHDRRLGKKPGSTATTLGEQMPGLRLHDTFARHSSGEQALITALLDLDCGKNVPLLGAGRYLDAHTRQHLTSYENLLLASGRMAIEITTDAEELVEPKRIIVYGPDGVMADGRAMAIAEHLPLLPRLAAACAPARLAGPAEVIAAVSHEDSFVRRPKRSAGHIDDLGEASSVEASRAISVGVAVSGEES